MNLPPNSLESFARTAEAVAATTKKLQKAKLLGDYFEHLSDEDLTRAARYFAGQQFAQSDVRTTNVGGSILGEDAIARAFKQPLAEVSMANMLRGDIGEAAVRARAGALHTVEMRLFHPLKFMLATPASDLADIERTMPGQFFVEDKFDGIRAQAHVQDGRVAIYSRKLGEISIRFPELHQPLSEFPTDVIMDGEIITARGEQILPFSDLQKRLGRKVVSEELQA